MKKIIIIICAICLYLPLKTLAAPGDLIATINVPNQSPSDIGIGIAVNCENPVTMFYTNSFSPFLHKMTAEGVDLGSILLTDAASGASISFGAIAWDETRQILWAGTDSSGSPVKVYQIHPMTGVASFQFTANTGGWGFTDGLTYDSSDDSIWVSDDVSDVIDHHDASTGAYLGSITPKNANGVTLGAISGVQVGKENTLYLGQNGRGEIVQITKSGDFISKFTTVGGRDEDLECDVITFAPLEVLWSKDAYDNSVTAFEVEPGTCVCGGVGNIVPVDIKPNSCPNPLNIKSKGVLPVAVLGTDEFDVATIDPESIRLEGVAPLRWANADVGVPFEPYIGKEDCFEDCEGYSCPDGNMDLTLHFDKQEIVSALGDVNDGDCLVLKLTGNLKEECNGAPIIGEDVLLILKKGQDK